MTTIIKTLAAPGKLRRIVFAIAAIIALIIAITAFRSWRAYQVLGNPVSTVTDQWLIEVVSGDTFTGVTRRLEQSEVIPNGRALLRYAKLNNQADQIKAGEYLIDGSQSPIDILNMMVAGRVKLHQITLVEGWTVTQILAAVKENNALEHTLADAGPDTLAAKMGSFGDLNMEGWIYPDTYRFAKGMTDVDLLKLAHKRMKQQLDEAWAQRHPHLPLENPYQALILASIIEKETAVADERARIGGVFIERLNRGMRLQTDPTVIYGLGAEFNGNLTRKHLETDTPYNTYTRAGLPPTPIAAAGKEALVAATQPEITGDLFFVATGKGDGRHRFSKTLDEHNRAVAEYLATLRRGG